MKGIGNTAGILALIIVVVIGLGVVALLMTTYTNPSSGTTTIYGTVLFAAGDPSGDISGVTSVVVTVDSVEAHSTTQGWVTITNTNTQQTFDLIKLKQDGTLSLVANASVQPGTYDQLRLDISSVVVTDANGTHQAKLPSSVLKINTVFNVTANSTTAIKFDFSASESLHITGDGKYIMAPVLNLEVREGAQAEVDASNHVTISGGEVKDNEKVGMDVNGNVGVGLGIPSNAELEIGNDSSVRIVGNGKVSVSLGSY